jgi:integrase
MGRPNSGEVTERLWKDDKTITFGARLYAYGHRHRLAFGTNSQGWNRTRAEIELESILQQVERGTWVPPEKRTSVAPKETRRPDGHQLFGAFARRIIEAKKSHNLDDDTIADLEWKAGYLVGHFGRLELLEIDVVRTDAFRDELANRAKVIEKAAARGKPLMETIKGRGGKPYRRRKRPLSNTSINAILELLSQILQRADDYEYIPRNPMKIGDRKDRYLPEIKPPRTWLEIDEVLALLEAAGELDVEARLDRRTGRRAALATLILTGFRISELCDRHCSQVDLARQRFRVPDAKTPKGEREVEMTLWLHDVLLLHREQRLRDGFPMAPGNHFFGTRSGRRGDPNRFRDRVLNRATERANTNRAKQGLPPLARITPHSLRRTWAMLAAQAGRDPHWISDQIGHTSAAFTLQVYQQVRHRRPSQQERQAIWELMRFADEPSECPFIRRQNGDMEPGFRPINGTISDPGESNVPGDASRES